MTGPEHYREAEQHLAAIDGKQEKAVHVLLAKAQVHATLALAAATAAQLDTIQHPKWWEATAREPRRV